MIEMVSFGDGSIYCSDKHIKENENGLYERIHAKTTSANEITGQSMKLTIHFKEYLENSKDSIRRQKTKDLISKNQHGLSE